VRDADGLSGLGLADRAHGPEPRLGSAVVGGHQHIELVLGAVDHHRGGADVIRLPAEITSRSS